MIMDDSLVTAKQNFVQGMSRISHFWGFPKGMGAIFGSLYLSPHPLSLDDLVAEVNISKGAVSTNIRSLERLGLVHKHLIVGDRKDYYFAETDFWKVIKSVLREREQTEFDHAINSVSESLDLVQSCDHEPDAELAEFYQQRLTALQSFFNSLDNLVAAILGFDQLRSGAVEYLVKASKQIKQREG
jgi:DNA-binding transcriptional regulator GbsR (MarR family)